MSIVRSLPSIDTRRKIASNIPTVSIAQIDSKNGTNSTVHNLVNVPAGALLVLTTEAETHSKNATVSSVPSLTWTKRVDSQAVQSGDAEIHTAIFGDGGAITITSAFAAQRQSSVCYVILNAEPILGGATASANLQDTASLNIVTTRANSVLICVTSDWNAVNGSSRTYLGSPIESQYYFLINSTTGYHYYKYVPSNATFLTMGVSSPPRTVFWNLYFGN